jgi:hypothetical protein
MRKVLIGLLVVTIIPLMIISAPGNNSSILNNTILNNTIPNNTIPNATILNNAALGNMSQNLSARNITAFNSTKPDKSEKVNNLKLNDSAELNNTRPGPFNKTAFVIGNAAETNKTVFVLSTPVKSVKDASRMWYIIQGVPHGYT